MTTALWRLCFVISSVSLLVSVTTRAPPAFAQGAAVTTDEEQVAIYQSLVEWVVASGGLVNPKQEYRREADGPFSRFGMFATERIEEGEILCNIPWKCILTAGLDTFDTALHCNTAQLLIDELRKGEASENFAPYMKYLLSLPHGIIPSSWTDAGKDLLELVLATDLLPPQDPIHWIDDEWKGDCRGSDDEFEQHAAMLLLSKGDDDRMVPIFDMYNHRNGPWFNTDNVFNAGVSIQLVATRVIEPGEQIYFSYNMCSDCQNRNKNYGTPEILRDYGFIEQLPQRWTFFPQKVRFDIYEDPEDGQVKLQWRQGSSKEAKAMAHLQMQLKRLETIVRPHLESITQKQEAAAKEDSTSTTTDDELPKPYELHTIWEYYKAITFAMAKAINESDIKNDTECKGGYITEDGTCRLAIKDGYSGFTVDDYDDENYQHTCDNKQIMKFNDYDDLVDIQSVYQHLTFIRRPTDKNICFDLDNTVQICSNYRPHYHEYATHLPARFMSSVKRAVFVGGGDSMLLHELLKYPDIELVLGLELDQTVVRNSFKYFKTQPHFDDERVQWWFGDATKSLLMLPKDYFGSFDLVLVDLSETVMSFTVTKDLDMLQALALLIKPDGIFVKNEQYFDKMGDMFDYSMQSYFPAVPIICDQAYSMGSNRIDFLHPNVDNIVKGHDVEMILLEEIDNPDDRFQHIQYYQKTSARDQGKCNATDQDESDMKLKRAGLLMILEAEEANEPTLKGTTLEIALQSALEKEGLRVVSATTHPATVGDEDGKVIVIVLREGFVAARTWPKERYCAFDIYLWGRFLTMDKVKKALADAVGSKKESLSSFRIVVGGMRGTDTWSQDRESIGPRLVQRRNCEEEKPVKTTVKAIDRPSMMKTVLAESLNMIVDKDILALVLCPSKDQRCDSLDVLSANANVRDVLVLYPCPNVEKSAFLDDTMTPMFVCEIETTTMLRKWVKQEDKGKLSAIVVDPDADMSMVQIVERIARNERNQRRLFQPHVGLFVPMVDMTQTWRRNFLEKCRSFLLEYDTIGRAEVVLHSLSDTMEMGILTTNDEHFFVRVLNVTAAIEGSTGLEAVIPKIKGQPMKWQDYQPREYLPEDYDPSPAEEQFKTQRPLGHQMILQTKLAERKGTDKAEIASSIQNALETSLGEGGSSSGGGISFTKMETNVYSDLGSGILILIQSPEGSAIAVYDGKSRLTIDLFTYNYKEPGTKSFVDAFLQNLPRAKVLLRDEHPRGIGRVVNFWKDTATSDAASPE